MVVAPTDPVRVLFIEDDEDDYVLTRDALEAAPKQHYELVWAKNYHEAAALLGSSAFDVCLLDVYLGAENGLDVLRRLREEWPDLPVILLTGLADSETDAEAMRRGAMDYLPKANLGPAVLERSIRHGIQRGRSSTERVETMAREAQARRMEALGTMAGGVVHEMNNALAIILAEAELLSGGGLDEGADERLRAIRDAARRAGRTLGRLAGYSAAEKLDMRSVDVGAVVRDLIPTLQGSLPAGTTLTVTTVGDGRVSADEGALRRIVIALVENAAAVVGPTDEVRVELTAVASGSGEVPPSNGPGHLVLRVSDTGPGMAADVADRALEPFFTTHDRADHSGLGLSTVYGLVRQHGGTVDLASREGHGTEVVVSLPRGTAHTQAAASPLPDAVRSEGATECGPGAREATILVVDDEERLRAATAAILRRLGYEVYEAHDGSAAVGLLATLEDPVDLVVSDVVMPEMGGLDLYHALDGDGNGPAFVFMSGYDSAELVSQGLLEARFPVLRKPWEVHELAARVGAALETAASRVSLHAAS